MNTWTEWGIIGVVAFFAIAGFLSLRSNPPKGGGGLEAGMRALDEILDSGKSSQTETQKKTFRKDVKKSDSGKDEPL